MESIMLSIVKQGTANFGQPGPGALSCPHMSTAFFRAGFAGFLNTPLRFINTGCINNYTVAFNLAEKYTNVLKPNYFIAKHICFHGN